MGAEVHYVTSREARAPAMAMLAEGMRSTAGNRTSCRSAPRLRSAPSATSARWASCWSRASVRTSIVHACSSGGTTAGLAAGCALHGLDTRVIGVSADDPAAQVVEIVRRTIAGIGALLEVDGADLARRALVEVDDTQVGEGYGIPTERSREAQRLAARMEAIFVDHTYTAKALGALIAWVREERFRRDETVVFWHTGGQVGTLRLEQQSDNCPLPIADLKGVASRHTRGTGLRPLYLAMGNGQLSDRCSTGAGCKEDRSSRTMSSPHPASTPKTAAACPPRSR